MSGANNSLDSQTSLLFLSAGTNDPTVVPTSGLKGNIYIRYSGRLTNPVGLYQKQDDGVSTNWQPVGAGGGGGFTEGSIPFADSSGLLTQNNSQLFWNAANNFMGIGTSDPQRKVHVMVSDPGTPSVFVVDNVNTVNNNGATMVSLRTTTTGVGASTFVEAVALRGIITSHDNTSMASSFTIGTVSSGSLSTRIRITSSGLISMGAASSSPGAAVEVDSPSSVTKGFLVKGAAAQSANLMELQTSTNSVVASISPAGNTYIAGSLGLNQPTVNPSAGIEMVSTTKGFLFPRMTTAQKNAIVAPSEGLVVYDLTLHKLCLFTGVIWETITSL